VKRGAPATQAVPAGLPEPICGVDEAGRGPLAGPVVAAAVILDPAKPIDGLRDSKQLAPARRRALAARIRSDALAWAIAAASVDEIDALNILQATLLAMRRAVAALQPAAASALVDGNRLPTLSIPALACIGGDATQAAISAASILAKTARDEAMAQFDARFPGYGFALHAGYPTPDHLRALQRLGPCAFHRLTFAPVARACRGEAPADADAIRGYALFEAKGAR